MYTCYKILIHVAIYQYKLQDMCYMLHQYMLHEGGSSVGAVQRNIKEAGGRHFHLCHDSLLFSFHFAKPIVALLLILAAVIACNEPAEGKHILPSP